VSLLWGYQPQRTQRRYILAIATRESLTLKPFPVLFCLVKQYGEKSIGPNQRDRGFFKII
jgi:hypothetical protein